MEDILAIFTAPPQLSRKHDDSFADRLSSRYTVVVLLMFATLVGVEVYVGDPIKCWAPQHFTDSHTAYANSYCWVKNTYYLPYSQPIPKAHQEHEKHHVPYYRWVPFILVAQAFMFYFPSIIWHGLNQRGGIDCDNILSSAHSLTSIDKEETRELIMRLITNQIDRFLGRKRGGIKKVSSFRKAFSTLTCHIFGRRFGAYLVMLNLIVKVFYITNVICQFILLEHLLNSPFGTYGFAFLKNPTSVSDSGWEGSPYVIFPRVTMCDFNIRRLGNVHRYTLQCTLPINLYNEKIFLFLWFWFFFVSIAIIIDFFTWLGRTCMRKDRISYVQSHLRFTGRLKNDTDAKLSLEFVDNYLRQDGVFLMRLIGHNTNRINVTEITGSLWDKWRASSHVTTELIPKLYRHEKRELINDTSGGEVRDTLENTHV